MAGTVPVATPMVADADQFITPGDVLTLKPGFPADNTGLTNASGQTISEEMQTSVVTNVYRDRDVLIVSGAATASVNGTYHIDISHVMGATDYFMPYTNENGLVFMDLWPQFVSNPVGWTFRDLDYDNLYSKVGLDPTGDYTTNLFLGSENGDVGAHPGPTVSWPDSVPRGAVWNRNVAGDGTHLMNIPQAAVIGLTNSFTFSTNTSTTNLLNITVSGAGTAVANGDYVWNGTTLHTNSSALAIIDYGSDLFGIVDADTQLDFYYFSTNGVEGTWQTDTEQNTIGTNPAPTAVSYVRYPALTIERQNYLPSSGGSIITTNQTYFFPTPANLGGNGIFLWNSNGVLYSVHGNADGSDYASTNQIAPPPAS